MICEYLQTWTAQQVFDKVAVHLLTQMQRSIGDDGRSCQYRSGPLKCAAGVLIPDHEYKKRLEGNTWTGLDVPFAHQTLIMEMQGIHDKIPPNCWKQSLLLLARKYHLSTDAIKEL